MKWGPKAGQKVSDGEWFAKLADQGAKVPAQFRAKPELRDSEVPFWEAFQALHLSRANTGFGPGSIPLSEMVVYAELIQMPTGEERELFVQVIRALDGAYLTFAQEKK